MLLMSCSTAPIFCAASTSPFTVALVRSASATAPRAICEDWATCRLISPMELVSCSDAAATVCTLADACSAATATASDWRLAAAAICAMRWALPFISSDAATVLSAMPRTLLSRLSASWFRMARLLSCSAAA
ncbi:hypothetical protein D3C71_1627340 [compost metagenome]